MLIGEILSETAKRLPDKTAIRIGAFAQTFAELDRAANRFANAMIAAGLGKGHNVAILSTNQAEYPAIFFGAARSGAVLAHLSPRFSDDELARVADETDIEAVFAFAGNVDQLLRARNRLPKLARIVVFGGDAPAGTEALEGFLGHAADSPSTVALAPEDPFSITYTGGTTGLPKGVVASHESRVIGSVRAAREFELEPDDVFCCSTPLFHIAGLFVWFQTGVLNGNTQVLMPGWNPDEFIRLVEEEGVTAAFLVPTQINSVISHPEFSTERLSNWRFCSYGGAPNAVAQLERMLKLLPDVLWSEQYGQSEAGNLTVCPSAFAPIKMGSAGRAFTDVDLAIFDNDDKPLPTGAVGEVVTRGPQVMLGYYKNPEATAEVMTADGWIRTGDVGYLDEDGFLFLVDRSKDLIISGGENIFPTEVENALYQHPSVHECAVFGIPDSHWGELPAAHVVLKPGADVSEDTLVDFCAERVARHKRPRMIKFVDELPKTAVGKIQKTQIRAAYWTDRDRTI